MINNIFYTNKITLLFLIKSPLSSAIINLNNIHPLNNNKNKNHKVNYTLFNISSWFLNAFIYKWNAINILHPQNLILLKYSITLIKPLNL